MTKSIEAIETKTVTSISIKAKEWFDKTYGNSYFSAQIEIGYNNDWKNTETICLPIQYGYGDHFEDMSKKSLVEKNILPDSGMRGLYPYCQDNEIHFHSNMESKCLKRDVKSWGEA